LGFQDKISFQSSYHKSNTWGSARKHTFIVMHIKVQLKTLHL